MSDRKAVIKNADMSEEMQQVCREVLLKVKELLLEKIFFFRQTVFKDIFHLRTLSTAPPRPWRSTTLRRTLQLTSRRSLTKSKTNFIEA